MLKLVKYGLNTVSALIPQKVLVKVIIGLTSWGVKKLVKSTKTTLDDEALAKVEKIINKDIIVK